MNHTKNVCIAIALVVAMSLVAGCTATQATPTVQVCPTAKAQSCPTVEAQTQSTMNPWRIDYSYMANIRITFSPGDKCTMDALSHKAQDAQFLYEMVVNDQTYENYMVGAVTLDEGKTLQDLEEYFDAMKGFRSSPPPFAKLQFVEIVAPLSTTWHGFPMPVSPIYLTCFVQGPAGQRAIGTFGPIEIIQ